MTPGKNISPEFNNESATSRPDAMSDAEYATAFKTMAQHYFTGHHASDPPKLLYVTGLPGAGKSTYVAKAKQDDPAVQDYVHINFDDLRVYHPRYTEHVAKDPVNSAARIDTAVERLIGWLTEESAERGLNVLLDDAAMGRDMTQMVLTPFSQAGYDISAVIIAVPSSIARQDVHLRFEENTAAAQNGAPVIPRWVNTEEQDNAPAALIETAETLESGLAQKITVVTRAGQTLSGAACAAVKAEMTRELDKGERAAYADKAQRIAALSNGRTGTATPKAGKLSP
ncbi:MAG: zeta toxin family protein [Alphaproteobacteria bacterium]